MCPLETALLCPLNKYLAMQLRGRRVILFLIFWGISTLFSRVATPVCIPTSSAKGWTNVSKHFFSFKLCGNIFSSEDSGHLKKKFKFTGFKCLWHPKPTTARHSLLPFMNGTIIRSLSICIGYRANAQIRNAKDSWISTFWTTCKPNLHLCKKLNVFNDAYIKLQMVQKDGLIFTCTECLYLIVV